MNRSLSKFIVAVSLVLTSFFPVYAAEPDILSLYPHCVIANGYIETSIFLPDSTNGFYRSSRYDWSGMNWQLTYKGHTFFMLRKFQAPHDPEVSGHGAGLAEEFSIGTNIHIPQRFTEAFPGETFVKIGVGRLEKPNDGKEYHFGNAYRIIDSGVWKISSGKNWIEFTHELSDPYGYGYRYLKRMELHEDKPELVISHTLTNTGTQTIEADQYCHNFFTIDFEQVGTAYEVQLFFPVNLKDDISPYIELRNNMMRFTSPVDRGIFSVVTGFGDSLSHNRCIIRNMKSKAGVEITGDFPLAGLNFYADSDTVCPELFAGISIEPGKSYAWSRTYRFFDW